MTDPEQAYSLDNRRLGAVLCWAVLVVLGAWLLLERIFNLFTPHWYANFMAKRNTRGTASTEPTPEATTDEGKLHDDILAECNRRGWIAVHSRMDRPTTTACGVPDFIILADGGRMLFVEAKRRGAKLTTQQAGWIAWAQKNGHPVHVVRSFAEFLELRPI